MLCAANNYNYMGHLCLKKNSVSNLIKQLLTKYQIFKKLPQILHIHKNHNFLGIIGIFRPTASSSLSILWQGHVRNVLFHFCQLWAVNVMQMS